MAEHLPNSIFTVAPERESEFDKSLDNFDLILSAGRPWRFCADPQRREIFVGRGAVELLWCASLAHFLFYSRLVGGRKIDRPTEIDPRSEPAVRSALDLLKWAIDCQLTKNTADDWPYNLPTPQGAPPDGAENAANELCLVSSAFMLHHELAHLNLLHSADVSNVLSLSQEKDADIAAAEWILDGIDSSGPMFKKRLLGVVGALLMPTIMGLYGWSMGGERHPFSYDRLSSILGRFAYAGDHVATWVAFAILDLHLQNSGRRLQQTSFSDPDEALQTLCDQLADEAHGRAATEGH
jgi:hypothetical protein